MSPSGSDATKLKFFDGNKDSKEGLKRDWGLELVHDQSVPGLIPATSATFSREPGMLKFVWFVWCWHTHNRMGNKNNLISAALTGLNKYSLRTKRSMLNLS